MIDKQIILNWLNEEGLLKQEIQDESANFHFIVNYPQDHMMDLISPKGKEDMILIGCATEIAEEQKNLIKKAPIQVNENFIWAIRFNLNQFLVDFELEHPNSQLEKFLITEEIFEDGLSKNEIIHTFKRIYKAKLQCLWLLEKTFGQKTINVDQL